MRLYRTAAALAFLVAPILAGCGTGEPEEPAVVTNPELEQQVIQQIQARQNQNVVPPPAAPQGGQVQQDQ